VTGAGARPGDVTVFVARTAARRRRRQPRTTPNMLTANPPRQSVIITMSQSGRRSYQNAKSRLWKPL
jgi:hypothetical protein